MIEKGNSRFKRDAHAGAVQFNQNVVRKVGHEVQVH